MKRHDRFTKFERHGLAEFVIYSNFDGVELAKSHRYIMRSDVRDVNDATVFAGDVTDPQKRTPDVTNRTVGREYRSRRT